MVSEDLKSADRDELIKNYGSVTFIRMNKEYEFANYCEHLRRRDEQQSNK